MVWQISEFLFEVINKIMSMMEKVLLNLFYISTIELQQLLPMTERGYLLEKL